MATASDQKIQDFINLTGAPVEVARTLLEACCGNLEMAIGMHLDSAMPPSENRGLEGPVTNSSGVSSGENYEEIHGIRAPIPSTQGVLIEQEAQPTRRTFHRRKLPTSVFDPFQDFSKLSSSSTSQKHQTLAELFKPPSDIMFQGTFQEARRCGQDQQKWLLVNLQDSREFNCQILNRDIWRNLTVRKILKDHFIFLQLQRITDDGAKFQLLYNLDTFPSIVIIDPRTGENMAKLNDTKLTSFLEHVQEFLAFNSLNHQEGTSANNKEQCIYDQSESQQLEAAIKASMKEQTDQGEEGDSDYSDYLLSPEMDSDIEQQEEHSNRTAINRTVSSNKNHKRKRSINDDSIHQELPPTKHSCYNTTIPQYTTTTVVQSSSTCSSAYTHSVASTCNTVTVNVTAGSDCNDLCTLLIRYPDGRRSVKSFNADECIKELFSYLYEEGINLQQHEIITTFPRTLVSSFSPNVTFKQTSLYPRSTIYIQTTQDE